jgi:hypothetical protein
MPMASPMLISSVFPIRGKWNLQATSSDNTPKPRLGLLISDRFPSVGLSVAGSVCSRVALEAILNEVHLVLVTRVRMAVGSVPAYRAADSCLGS